MPLRTSSDIILAANQAMDLTSLITTYLLKLEKASRMYYKGYKNPVKVRSPFVVNIVHVGEDFIKVGLTGTTIVTYESPNYYGPDDESFTEGYGVSNISGYTTHVDEKPVGQFLHIPFGCLLRTEEQMWEDVNKIVHRWSEEDKAEAKAEKIARLERELTKVRAE